jgi:PhoH-like ATPase
LNYSGLRYEVLSNEQLELLAKNKLDLGMQVNEYLIVLDEKGAVIDRKRWTGTAFTHLKFKKINSKYFGEVSAINEEQYCALDLLQDKSIIGKMLVGGFGVGKSLLSICWALSELEKTKPDYDCLYYIRNNFETANSVPLGALPQGIEEKLFPFAFPLIDILGNEETYQRYLQEGKVRLAHVGHLRGRTFKRSIVYITEAQNMTTDLMALLIARIGEGSCLIVDGDVRQCDKDIFKKHSGIVSMAEKLKGNPMFGMVTLQKDERSEFSALSNLLLND